MRRHAVHEVLFEKPKQDKVTGKKESELFKWYASLSDATRQAVRDGSEKVKLDGYASTTDKATNNRELARRRVESVKAILRDFGAKTFDDAAFGEYVPGVGEPEGEEEKQDDRKVVIEIIEAPEEIYAGDEDFSGAAP
jgi:outer membrane protein OmpA-like peptidoglycan-associated protein